MPAAPRTHPELIGLPWSAGGRVAHLHVVTAALAAQLQLACGHGDIDLIPSAGGPGAGLQSAIVVPALILAAGESSRMGRAKALLRSGDSHASFLEELTTALRLGGVGDVLVIGRPDDVLLQEEGARLIPPIRFVPNPHADTGQLSSVIAGLNVADRPGTRGILLAPVDMPLVTGETVAALLGAFRATLAPIVRPVCQGRHGHPVIFGRTVFDQLRHADPSEGARAVVHANRAAIVDIEVSDPGVLVDIDTPEDYARVFGRAPA